MSAEEKKHCEEPSLIDGRTVSRREFLKIAGIAGAVVGMGAGMGGLLAACGEEEETTTTAGEATTTTGAQTTTTAAPSTTVDHRRRGRTRDQGRIRRPDHWRHSRIRYPRQVVRGTLE